MDNLLAILIITLCLGGALYYIFSQKRKGVKCIGCPLASACKRHKCNRS